MAEPSMYAAMRPVQRVVGATPFGPRNPSLVLRRVIGGLDIDGKGTSHPVEAVGPFIFADEAVVPADFELPFGKHPHCGLVANTCPLNYHAMLWDNHNGAYGPVWGKGVYQVYSGDGIVHDEGHPLPAEVASSKPDRPSDPLQHTMQVWFNPGVHLPLQKAQYNLIDPEDVPVLEEGGGALQMRLLLGSYQTHTSFSKTWNAELFMMDCVLAPKANARLHIPRRMQGWLYPLNLSKALCVNGHDEVQSQHIALFDVGEEDAIHIVNKDDAEPVRFFFGAGTPFTEPWYKLLGHDGALVASSEEGVRAAMKDFEAHSETFGRI